MVKKSKRPSQGIAIAGLLINVLVLPGLGSIIAGKNNPGIYQLVLSLVAVVLDITIIGLIIGIPLGIAMWIWALVTGIRIVQESQ